MSIERNDLIVSRNVLFAYIGVSRRWKPSNLVAFCTRDEVQLCTVSTLADDLVNYPDLRDHKKGVTLNALFVTDASDAVTLNSHYPRERN